MGSQSNFLDPFADFEDGAEPFGSNQAVYEDDDFDLNLNDPYPAAPKTQSSQSASPFDDADEPFEMTQALSQSAARTAQSVRAQAARPESARPAAFEEIDADSEVIAIPRIAIHFFAENIQTEKACMAASTDRRMQRAQCLVRTGGIDGAVVAYQSEPTPSLLIVESNANAQGIMESLGRLAEVCDPNTKVVVIGAHNDIRLYRELVANGISEYVVAPIQPLNLIKVIGGLFNDPESPFCGRTLAFVGARGGAGASTVAHNFAYLLSQSMQANTVLVDYDLAFGTAGLDFNQDAAHGLGDALNAPERLDSVLLDRMLVKCSENLSLFASPAVLDQDYTSDPEIYQDVTQKIRASAPFIVMDLPHTWSPWVKQNLIAADDVIIVATPDLASLRNAKNIIDLLKNARPNDKAPKVVLNQVETPGRPEIPLKDFTAALGIEPIVEVPFDAKLFGQAANNGQMVNELDPKAKASQALAALTGAVTGRAVEVKTVKKSLLASLFKK